MGLTLGNKDSLKYPKYQKMAILKGARFQEVLHLLIETFFLTPKIDENGVFGPPKWPKGPKMRNF